MMRRLEKRVVNASIIVLFQFFTASVFAQDTSVVQHYDLYAAQLDKSEMKTSVLYDRVFSFAKLNTQVYSNVERNEIPKDYKSWNQIYLEMYNADYSNSSKEDFEKHLKKSKDYSIYHKMTPIGIINYNYEFIDSNAIADGRIEIKNGFLHRNFKKIKSPFIVDSICVLSILGNQIYTGETKLIFDKDFYYTNTAKKPKSIRLNFYDDKGWITLEEGISKTIIFNQVKRLKYSYEIIFNSSEIIKADAYVNIVSSGTAPCYTIMQGTKDEYEDYSNVKAKALYEFGVYSNHCATNDTNVLHHPIIIVDGFDPSDTRKIGNIFDLMNEAPIKLADTFLAKGYDIIICNFLNGADFIERNALAVQDVIKYVKSKTKDKIIVIGPSMGGLVAKCALNNFEKTNQDHQTSLYFSFDSPHQGANIPIADQYFLDFFGRIVGNAEAYAGLVQIKSSAAKQMLLDYYDTDHIAPLSHVFRNIFTYTNATYPSRLRKVSLINGSGESERLGVNGKLFSLLMQTKTFNVTLAEAQIYSSPSKGVAQVAYLKAANVNNILKPYKMRKFSSVILGSPFPININDAPGAYFNTQEIITGLETGQSARGFTVYNAIHNFIPSVSSLDIKSPTGYVNYAYNIDSSNIVCDALTPFDAYYAPKKNEMHVTVTKENANWIKREIYNSSKTTTVTSKSQSISSNEVYNYGAQTKTYYDKSFSITDGGVFGVNMNMPTGNASESTPITGTVFKVEGYNTCSSAIIIDVLNNSEIIIGDKNTNVGELSVSENTILNLIGSKIKIYNHSKLLIEKGCKLIIGKESKIELIGEDAQLIIDGDIEFTDDCKLSVIGSGKLIFNNKQLNFAKNANLLLKGSDQHELNLIFNNESYLEIPRSVNRDIDVQIKNVKVEFNSSSNYIYVSSGVEIENTSFAGGRGLVLNALDDISISNCVFSDNKIGITYIASTNEKFKSNKNIFELNNCKFYNCGTAIKSLGKGFAFDNLEIEKCKQAIIADDIEIRSKISNSIITGDESQSSLPNSNSAISFIGINGSTLEISNTIISNFNVGIYHSQSMLNLNCTNITDCYYKNIWVANNAILNLAPSGYSNSGNNTLTVNNLYSSNIFLEQANNLFISNGANKFKLNGLSNNYYIAGTMLNIPQTLNLQHNNWYENTNASHYLSIPKLSNFVVSKTAGPSSPRIANYITQPVLGSTTISECINYYVPVKDPCEKPGSCDDYLSSDPLVYAEHAKTIKTEGFDEAPLNIVLKQVLNKIKEDVSNSNSHLYFNALKQISLIDETYEFDEVSYLLDLAYASMLDVFYKLEEIPSVNIDLERSSVENLMQERLTYFKDHNENLKLFNTYIDLSHVKLSNNNFDEAISLLYEALAIAENKSCANLANHWICIVDLKRKISEGASFEEIENIANSCEYNMDTEEYSARPAVLNIDTVWNTSIEMQVYPNPNSGELSIELQGDNEKINEVMVVDLQGRELLKFKNINMESKLSLDLNILVNGMYNLHVKTNKKESFRKISIQK